MMEVLNHLGTDVASKMLSALTFEAIPAEPHETIPLDEQKRYLKRHIDSVRVEDRKSIGSILVMNNSRQSLKWCSEGTVINLDTLPPNIVEQMYNLLSYKINKVSEPSF